MRYLAILCNLFLLGVFVVLFATEGGPKGKQWLLAIPIFLAPLSSLAALLRNRGDNWLSLYFKRKALEEKRKIDQLSGNKDQT